MHCLKCLAQGSFYRVPYDAILYVSHLQSGAGAVTEFGLGTSSNNAVPIFTGLPNNPLPANEVQIGFVPQGTDLNFYEWTVWGDQTGWAFSYDTTSPASRCAFMDTDNSLGLGGSIIVQTSPTTWTLHLDDAMSYQVDDNDADVLIQLRLGQVPEPSSVAILMAGGLTFLCVAASRKNRNHG
jgi:hypothetical protein